MMGSTPLSVISSGICLAFTQLRSGMRKYQIVPMTVHTRMKGISPKNMKARANRLQNKLLAELRRKTAVPKSPSILSPLPNIKTSMGSRQLFGSYWKSGQSWRSLERK
jgi:hypothetical protein